MAMDETISTGSAMGLRQKNMGEGRKPSYLMIDNKKVGLVAKITIGRDSDNDVVIDNKLASRHHAEIQKIKDEYFIKDNNSTNGTYVNSTKIPKDKYVKLNVGDQIKIGNMSLIMS